MATTNIGIQGIRKIVDEHMKELQSTADRRLELLKEVEWIYKTGHKFCPICFSYKVNGHADDCRLAKELSDEH